MAKTSTPIDAIRAAFEAVGADVSVIGNAALTGAERCAEVMKLKPEIEAGRINKSDVVRFVGESNGMLSNATLIKWLKDGKGSNTASPSAGNRKSASKPVFTPEAKQDGGRYISKAEVYFFDAVLATMTDDDIENAQQQAQARIAQEALAAIQEAAAREVNPMLEAIKARRAEQLAAMDAPEAPQGDETK
ncbi:hypothetical protein ACCW94_02880 [Enterobacter soli]|uniref:hypothetical protein n=1 Tax=Enterobacter soli TaxID=885040 RepID=UPI003EDA7DF1